MRPNNNNNRRGRGRGSRKPHGGSHGGMSGKSQGYDGNTSDVRVRGNAYQVLEKYLQLARDAGTAGDRVAAENFLQHADHYYRVVSAMQEGQRPRIGGRDVSVADVNVQNVTQGLSAALYSGHPQPVGQQPNGSSADRGPNENAGREPGGQSGIQRGNGGQQVGSQGHGAMGRGSPEAGSQRLGGHMDGNSMDRGTVQHHEQQQQVGYPGGASNASSGGESSAGYAPQKSPDEQPDYPADLIPSTSPQETGEGDRSGRERTQRMGRGRGRRGPQRRPRGETAGDDAGPGGSAPDSSE